MTPGVLFMLSRKGLVSAHTSGVSAGHSMPHWLGCKERGPDTLRVFSNCELILVIMPMAATKDSRDSTCNRLKLVRPYHLSLKLPSRSWPSYPRRLEWTVGTAQGPQP